MLIAWLGWLYGQSLIGAALAILAWVPLAWRRWRSPERPPISQDAYLWVATGISGVLLGVVLGTAARVVSVVWTDDGAAGQVPPLLVASLILISAGSGALTWGSTVSRSAAAWRWFVALSLLWGLISTIWRF